MKASISKQNVIQVTFYALVGAISLAANAYLFLFVMVPLANAGRWYTTASLTLGGAALGAICFWTLTHIERIQSKITRAYLRMLASPTLLTSGIAAFVGLIETVTLLISFPDWIFLAFLGIFIGAFVILYFWVIVTYEDNSKGKKTFSPEEQLSRRVKAVNNAFENAEKLMTDLRNEVEKQQSARNLLLEEANQQKLALEINREQAEAIGILLTIGAQKESKKQHRRDVIFLILGTLLSIPISIVINLLTK